MRTIDADAVLEKAASDLSGKESFGAAFVFSIIKHVIDEQPTIEAQPVRHGRWIPTEYDGYADGYPVYDAFECSECGHEHSGEEDTLTAFCPDCGAKMEEGGEDAKTD